MRYLMEIGVEEFPSRLIQSTKDQLKEGVEKGLAEAGVRAGEVRVEATPRRFALWLEDLVVSDTTNEEIVRGPSKKAAFDAEGAPTKALLGFLRSKGLSLEDTYVENNGKDDYVFARVKKAVVSIEDTLRNVMPSAIRGISNPRAMRWGGKNLRFLRPIRWILSLLDDQVLPFELEGISVSNRTNGHRFLGEKNIEIPSVAQYEKILEDNGVIVDASVRRDRILRGLNRLAREHGGVPLKNEELLEEVVYIVEVPTVFISTIPKEYLSLPPEVIITPMMDHQRYFPVVDDEGALLPYFLSVRNGNEVGLDNVIAGNRKVLIPRLEDAKFFFEQDLKKSLDAYVEELGQLTFHEALGTMKDKTARLEILGQTLAETFGCGPELGQTIQRAAHLSKADLVTKMVIEFTELQGTMGRIYAEAAEEDPRVARAIEEHYAPRKAGAALPSSTAGMVLAIADKLDTLAGLFAIDINVTGSQDPFGLRRAVIGLLEIIRAHALHFDLLEAIRDALLLYVEQQGLVFDYDDVVGRLGDFFRGRLRTKMEEAGVRYDVCDAVLATDDWDLYSLMKKADAVQERLDAQPEDPLFTSFVRVHSMAKHAETTEVDTEVLDPNDQALYALIQDGTEVDDAIRADRFPEALEAFKKVMPAVNQYLDQTMVLVEDPALRAARLGMLLQIDQRIRRILLPEEIVRA